MHNAKNNTSIIGIAVYIVINGKCTNICIYGRTLPKIRFTSKKVSNKCCLELNFVQKCQRAYVSICPWSGARGLERLIQLKYYVVLKRQITINLGLNAAKNMHYIKKKGSSKSDSIRNNFYLKFF